MENEWHKRDLGSKNKLAKAHERKNFMFYKLYGFLQSKSAYTEKANKFDEKIIHFTSFSPYICL